MRIGELSRISGVSRDTIRLYERSGLLHSHGSREDSNSYRDYPDECLVTLDFIGEAKSAGMTLADVSILLAQINAVPSEDFDGLDFLDAKIAEVKNRLARAERFLETLTATRAALERAPYADTSEE